MYVIVAGGGKVGANVARSLIRLGNEVTLIEQRRDRFERLEEEFEHQVQRGDATELFVLERAGITRPPDIVLALTGDDEDNMVICQLAKEKYGVPKVIARVNDPRNQPHFDLLGISPTICATSSIMALVEHEVPEHELIHLLELRKENLEIVEVQIDKSSPVAGQARRGAEAAGRRSPHLGHARRQVGDRGRLDNTRGRRPGARDSRARQGRRAAPSLAKALVVSTRRFIGLAGVLCAVAACAGSSRAASSGHDWTRFGWNAVRSNAPTFATGITAANVKSLTRQQVQLGGTADSSPIYLHAAQVLGASHDTFFVTTTYGKTVAVDAASGKVLWRFTPPGYSSWAGSAQITTATPVADPNRQWIYAASPGGVIYKLAVADGHRAWGVSITKLPSREKIAASLNFASGHVIATTGGYIGDAPPYQGHVAIINPAGALLHVWNSLCSNRTGLIEPSSCGASDSAIWGRAGAVVDPANGQLLVATGNAPWDGKTNWGDAVLRLSSNATSLLGNYTPTNTDELNSNDVDLGSTSPVVLSRRLYRAGRQGREDSRAIRQAHARKRAASRRGAAGRLDTVRHRSLHGARGLAPLECHVALCRGQRRHRCLALPQRTADPGLAERHRRDEPGRRGRTAVGLRARRRPECL